MSISSFVMYNFCFYSYNFQCEFEPVLFQLLNQVGVVESGLKRESNSNQAICFAPLFRHTSSHRSIEYEDKQIKVDKNETGT